MGRVFMDDKLEKEINDIMQTLRSKGYKVTKPDVIRMLVAKHKNNINVRRKRKSKEWEIL